jgi:hypothetical protein
MKYDTQVVFEFMPFVVSNSRDSGIHKYLCRSFAWAHKTFFLENEQNMLQRTPFILRLIYFPQGSRVQILAERDGFLRAIKSVARLPKEGQAKPSAPCRMILPHVKNH